MKKVIMKAEDLCKSFANNGGQNHVLDMVGLEIYEGDFTVIMGSSGAGKSTLLYALSGMDKPTGGEVYYRERPVSRLKEKDMAALREEQATHYMEYQQTQAIRARIHEAEQFYTRIRGLKHEMRGHLTNIKGLAQSGEYASLEDYIAKMDESMSGFELTLQTGNPVTDVIVNDIRRRCLDLGIRFQVEFHYPDPGAYDAFDVGIILQIRYPISENCSSSW